MLSRCVPKSSPFESLWHLKWNVSANPRSFPLRTEICFFSVCMAAISASGEILIERRRALGPKSYPDLWIMCKHVNVSVVSTLCLEADRTSEAMWTSGYLVTSFPSVQPQTSENNSSTSWKMAVASGEQSLEGACHHKWQQIVLWIMLCFTFILQITENLGILRHNCWCEMSRVTQEWHETFPRNHRPHRSLCVFSPRAPMQHNVCTWA